MADTLFWKWRKKSTPKTCLLYRRCSWCARFSMRTVFRVCVCMCVRVCDGRDKKCQPVYIYDEKSAFVLPPFFFVSNSLSFRVCHELLFTSTLIKWFRFVDNKNWLLSSDGCVTCGSLCIPFFFFLSLLFQIMLLELNTKQLLNSAHKCITLPANPSFFFFI